MDGTFNWGWVIFIVLILWFFVGGGLGARNSAVSETDLLKESYGNRIFGITESAQSQFRTIDEGDKTRDLLRSQEADRCAVELADAKAKNYQLENTIQLQALDLANERRFNSLQSQIERFDCETPKRPPYYADGCYPRCGNNGTSF